MNLLRDRSFRGYLLATFWNAFNDNAFATLVALVVLRMAGPESGGLVSIVQGIFLVPFFLFASWAGALADRYSKRTVFVVMHFYEVFAMVLATIAFATNYLPLGLAALFWSGAQSAFYSPAKYGLLPEALPPSELSRANGILQATTFVAILLGVTAGSGAMAVFQTPAAASAACAVVALLGLAASRSVWPVPAANPLAKVDWTSPFGGVLRALARDLRDPGLGAPMVGRSFFWFLGTATKIAILLFCAQSIFYALPPDVREVRTGALLVVLSIGIGAGSLLAGRWSGAKVEVGLMPLGALLTAGTLWHLGAPTRGAFGASIDLFLVGIGSGLFVVPLQAAVQLRAKEATRGETLSAANFLDSLAMTGAVGLLFVLEWMGVRADRMLVLLAILTFFTAAFLCVWLAEFLLRFVTWLVTHAVYDIRILGRENVPEKGPALLVANHVSFVDAILIGCCIQRFVRFLMHTQYYDHPAFRPFCRAMKAIPITPGRKHEVEKALGRAAAALREGHLVCIFAEGAITRTGIPGPFRRGFEMVAQAGGGAPVIPVHLSGVWGSVFSFDRGKVLWKRPRRIPYPVTVSFGAPLPADTHAQVVRTAVQVLGAAALRDRAPEWGSLAHGVLRAARARWFSPAVSDSLGRALPYGRLVALSTLLARRLRAEEGENTHLGVVLPPSSLGAATLLAAAFAGRVCVPINFTASREAIGHAIRATGLRRIVTSRAFREKVSVDLSGATEVFLEDLLEGIPKWRIVAFEILLAPLPFFLLARLLLPRGVGADDPAAVLFSSGSTGTPKGVVLTHANVRANVEGLAQVFDVRPDDVLIGALPFFHSFGFTGTLWFPLIAGFSAAYHPNPLDARGIGRLSAARGGSILVATPTFAAAYLKRIEPESFRRLRFTVVGAERCDPALARAWEEKYRSPLLEGYGTTECAPVVSVNLPRARKDGSIGHPLPGVAVRIVRSETGEILLDGAEGILEVAGPNVMQGYLGEVERTAEVLKDGWYRTGDVASIDRDGFLRITGRLSRFSKIGGEMVPHGRVEDALREALAACGVESPESCPALVVAGARESDGSERLVVLHAVECDPSALIARLREEGLPNLWIPKRADFRRVDSVPLLGTGKVDLAAVARMADPEGV